MKTTGNTILITSRASGGGLTEAFHAFGLPEALHLMRGDIR